MWRSLFILHLFFSSSRLYIILSTSCYLLFFSFPIFGSGVGCVILFVGILLCLLTKVEKLEFGGGETRNFIIFSFSSQYEVPFFLLYEKRGDVGGLREGSSEKYVITHQKVAFLMPTYQYLAVTQIKITMRSFFLLFIYYRIVYFVINVPKLPFCSTYIYRANVMYS